MPCSLQCRALSFSFDLLQCAQRNGVRVVQIKCKVMKLFERLSLSINSTRDFEDPALAATVLDALQTVHEELRPSRFGRYPPATSDLSSNMAAALSLWVNRPEDSRVRLAKQASGGLTLEGVHGVQYNVAWEKTPAPVLSSIFGSVPIALATTHDQTERLKTLIFHLAVLTNALYAESRDMRVKGWEADWRVLRFLVPYVVADRSRT